MDRFLRRTLLKPIARRKSAPNADETINAALDLIETRATAAAVLPSLAAVHKAEREQQKDGSWRDPAMATTIVGLGKAMFLARGVSAQEYTFMVSLAAESVHDHRMSGDAYPEVVKLVKEIRSVEAAHGLAPDDYWPVGTWPAEYHDLQMQYEAADHKRFVETLHEIGANDVADLYLSDRKEFDRRRERGRRAFFHKDELVPALTDTVIRYEKEAKKAAVAGAYTAAITLLGAAVEGLLILRCLRSPTKAQRIAAGLPRDKRPKPSDGPTKWKFDTLIETCLAAGWLPDIPIGEITILPGGLAHSLRQFRNLVHPGKVAEERPWVETDQVDYISAEATFTTLFSTVSAGKRLKLLREAAQRPTA